MLYIIKCTISDFYLVNILIFNKIFDCIITILQILYFYIVEISFLTINYTYLGIAELTELNIIKICLILQIFKVKLSKL